MLQEKQEYFEEKKLSLSHFLHHKSHMGCSGIETRPLGEKPASNKLPIFANDRNHTRLPTASSNIRKKKQFKREYEYYCLLV